MNYDNATLANVFSIATIVLGAVSLGLLVLWIRSREALLKARRDLELRALPNDRLHAIERSLDDLTLQVERVGEADRFAARLLAERLTSNATHSVQGSPSVLRPVTPH